MLQFVLLLARARERTPTGVTDVPMVARSRRAALQNVAGIANGAGAGHGVATAAAATWAGYPTREEQLNSSNPRSPYVRIDRGARLWCCATNLRRNGEPPVSLPCACESRCDAAHGPGCDFFSHDARKGTFSHCAALSNCSSVPWSDRSATTTWRRREAAAPSVTEASWGKEPDELCAKGRYLIFKPTVLLLSVPPQRRGSSSGPWQHVAKWLDSYSWSQPNATLPDDGPEPGCGPEGEEATFRNKCRPRIEEMDKHLNATRGVRGVVFIYNGASVWGWGNLLPYAYLLHHLARVAHRYAHVQLYDSALGTYLQYANGESWEVSMQKIQAEYGVQATRVSDLNIPANTVAPTGWARAQFRPMASHANWQRFVRLLAEHPAPLLEVHFTFGTWLDDFLKWAPSHLPLLAPPREDGRPRLDRCFCRYVTQPAFVKALPAPVRRRLQRLEAAPPRSVLHLRTMINHLPPATFTKANRPAACPNLASAHELRSAHRHAWIGMACNRSQLASGRTYVMSDAPGLPLQLAETYGDRKSVV